jgi:hypothetical protein
MLRRAFLALFAPQTPLYDNWVAVKFSGPVNGTNRTFTLQAGEWRKIEVFLNGQLMYQFAEVPSGAPYNVTFEYNKSPQLVLFVSPIPQVVTGGTPDQIFIRGTL